MFDSDEAIRTEIEGQGLDGSIELNMNWIVQQHEADLGFITEILKDVITNIEGYNPNGFMNAAIGDGMITFSWNFVMPADVVVVLETVDTETPYWSQLKKKIEAQGAEGSVYVNRDWFMIEEGTSHQLVMFVHQQRDILGLTEVETRLENNQGEGDDQTILFGWRIF